MSCDKLCSGNPEMTNLRTDENVFLGNWTKIGTDENKAIYSITLCPKSPSARGLVASLPVRLLFKSIKKQCNLPGLVIAAMRHIIWID